MSGYELVIQPGHQRDLMEALRGLSEVRIVGGHQNLVISATSKAVASLNSKFGKTLVCRPVSMP